MWTGCSRRSVRGNNGAPVFVTKNRLARFAPVVQREPKAGKKPRMEAKTYKKAAKKYAASAFFISCTVMSVSDDQR